MRTYLTTLAFLVLGSACAPADTPEPSIEYRLAVVHTDGYVAEDDPLVSRFARTLEHLEARCPETRERLADLGVGGHRLLAERNVPMSLLEVFEAWRDLVPDEAEKGDVGECSQILGTYIALRVQG